MQRRRSLLAVVAALSLALATGLLAAFAGDQPPDPYADRVAKANDEWKKTIQRIQLPKGSNLVATKWAAEPHVANMVAFAFDHKGRCYVVETFRLHKGVTDNRGHMYWIDDELACRTVEDRVAMYKKHHGAKFVKEYATEMDRVRLVEDTDGDGVADKSTVFSDGYKDPADGIAAGVLARKGKVWLTNIPSLWLLEDTKGTGRADVKKVLSTGYGVHVAFLGHDMHGLKMGPDGKLYFSIGDRGLNVKTEGRHLFAPDTGSVLRCNPDGSELEIVASGLRNPQELAFDEFGNLFTGDNNADGGDKARWVHLVEGGDSGWRLGYQYLPALGPWNAERIWHTQPTNTARSVLPPLAHIGNGPSGLTYHPGTSQLPEKYLRHFFLCDFRGNGGGSGVHSFALRPKGASFEVGPVQQFIWSVLATDCDFGPDGGFYVSDWVDGWGLTNKGRIFKVADSIRADDELVVQVKKLLGEGFDHRPVKELATLLDHADMRVRQEAQFALVDKNAADALAKVAAGKGQTLPRIHAIWGLGQLGRKDPKQYEPLIPLASDKDTEVRAQALKILGDGKVAAALEKVIAGLNDKEPRVRFFAAMAAGKLGKTDAVPALLEVAKANGDADPYLRHAVTMALAGINDKAALQKAADSDSPAVRLTALLAMRRQGNPEVAKFLTDADPTLVLEAARAIYDAPIADALPKLAALSQPGSSVKSYPAEVRDPVWQRALAAHYRLGGKDGVAALLAFAGRADAPEKLREEALKMLSAWEKPSGRDRVVGVWRPIPERDGTEVAALLKTGLASIMTGPAGVRGEGAKLAAKHGINEVGPVLRQIVLDVKQPVPVRIETLKALDVMKDKEVRGIAQLLLAGTDPRLRFQALVVSLRGERGADQVIAMQKVLEKESIYEKQQALAQLAEYKFAFADNAIAAQFDALLAGKLPPEVHLDVLEAARKRKEHPGVGKKLAEYEAKLAKDDKLAPYKEALVGGDADSGRAVFAKAELSCVRCHKVNGAGGEVGPELAGVGKKYKRDYLLESLVDPSKQIAKGYDTVVLVLKNGQIKTGVLKSEDAKEVRLMNAEGQMLVVPVVDIDERQRGPSAMPADLVPKMSRHELRDLIEYLSGL
jgi:quinoprotein glucose dehydrogenase